MAPFQPLGDCAFLVAGRVDDAAAPAGVLDIVPAFNRTAIYFDPSAVSHADVAAWLTLQSGGESSRGTPRRLVEVPVAYGNEYGPDLAGVAQAAGLSADEVVRRHAGAEYVVGAVGFQPGFGYLEGLPPELRTPRRATPRTAVPAGAVGIGGPYTGVYPAESPGGWNLIGRTPLVMFDQRRDEPSLLRHGDRVRFRAVDAAEFTRIVAKNRPAPPAEFVVDRPLLRVISPGVSTTLQGLPRYGQQHHGVTPGGAMDLASLRLANLLVGNDPGAAALESTLVGPILETIAPVRLALAGAVPSARCFQCKAGVTIDLRSMVLGARSYVAIAGGFAGHPGKSLAAEETLGSDGEPTPAPGRATLGGVGWRRLRTEGFTTLRILRGPQSDRLSDDAWRRFLLASYCVSPQSNRMGVRLEGPELRCESSEAAPSQPVCQGAIQLPPDGRPIVLGADRQTLGGYPVPAVVISADWPALGQLAPGDTVRFAEVTLDDATRLRKKWERDLALAAVGVKYLE
jgi:KipI family sensor histidine kinase inhibitor